MKSMNKMLKIKPLYIYIYIYIYKYIKKISIIKVMLLNANIQCKFNSFLLISKAHTM